LKIKTESTTKGMKPANWSMHILNRTDELVGRLEQPATNTLFNMPDIQRDGYNTV